MLFSEDMLLPPDPLPHVLTLVVAPDDVLQSLPFFSDVSSYCRHKQSLRVGELSQVLARCEHVVCGRRLAAADHNDEDDDGERESIQHITPRR